MKTAGRIVLLLAMMGFAFTAALGALKTIRGGEEQIPTEIYALYRAKSGRARYLLREKDGFVAVYESGERTPWRVTDIETALLRSADRAMLEKGIPAEDLGEMLSLLEDFGS